MNYDADARSDATSFVAEEFAESSADEDDVSVVSAAIEDELDDDLVTGSSTYTCHCDAMSK